MNVNNDYSNISNISSSKNNNISREMFLTILTQSMKNQDPMNPTDSNEFISQLVQFSNLEQNMNANDKLEELINISYMNNLNTAMLTATSAIGKHGEFIKENENEIVYRGTVKSCYVKDLTVYLEVEMDETKEIKEFKFEDLVKIEDNDN